MDKQEMMEMMEMMKAMLAETLAKWEAERKADREERMKANMDACMAGIKDNQEETTACQETMEARLEKETPASEDMTPEVAHEQEVPLEDAEVMPVGEPRKRRRDQRRNLAAVCRQKK
jgi:hypothetical protein